MDYCWGGQTAEGETEEQLTPQCFNLEANWSCVVMVTITKHTVSVTLNNWFGG